MQGSRADARVAAMLARHSGTLMRVARQCSLCHDDAADALQRALEIYVRRLDSVDPATEVAWLKVVVRHEAYAIRRSRGDTVSAPDLDLDAAIAAPGRSVEDQVVSGDRVSRSAEALRALKPDEARAR
jgi:DNA-directed RNA polymerase specialized sigma24 family protein